MRYFDAHAHIHFPEFDADREAVLERMRESETGAVLVGTDIHTSLSAVKLAEQHDFLWAAVGLHPNDNPTEVFDEAGFAELAGHKKVVAIGECGLDYYRSGCSDEEKNAQKKRFEVQIALASRAQKPLIIHSRNAHEDMIGILGAARHEYGGDLRIVMHFFSSNADEARKYIDLDCYLSFAGPITYTQMYDDSIRLAPASRFLSETDSPYAAPVPYRGRRNEPSYVQHIVEKIASARNEAVELVREQVLDNCARVFNLR